MHILLARAHDLVHCSPAVLGGEGCMSVADGMIRIFRTFFVVQSKRICVPGSGECLAMSQLYLYERECLRQPLQVRLNLANLDSCSRIFCPSLCVMMMIIMMYCGQINRVNRGETVRVRSPGVVNLLIAVSISYCPGPKQERTSDSPVTYFLTSDAGSQQAILANQIFTRYLLLSPSSNRPYCRDAFDSYFA